MALIPTFVDYVICHGKTRGNQPAILLADRVITYAMLAEATLTAEAKIADLKLPPGSIIGICVSSPIRHFALLSAIIRGGHTGISVYKVGDIAALGVSSACVLTEKLDFLPAFRQVVADDGWFASTNRLAAATSRPREENDVLRIEFSSGTTGRPKALDMTARLMASKIKETLLFYEKFAWSRASSLMDIQSGWGLRIVARVLLGGKSVLLHSSHVDALKIGVVYNVDCLIGSVDQVTELVNIQKADPVPNLGLKAVITGGSVIGQRQIEEICAYLSPNVVSAYASTEAGLIASTEGNQLLKNPRSAGPLVPWVDVRIEDEAGALQPLGTPGILKIRPFNGFAKPHGVIPTVICIDLHGPNLACRLI
jgi:acyl-coenzyme A synthetase/AMP-(fatty) acid ligase